MLSSSQVEISCQQINSFSSQALGKLFMSEALQASKTEWEFRFLIKEIQISLNLFRIPYWNCNFDSLYLEIFNLHHSGETIWKHVTSYQFFLGFFDLGSFVVPAYFSSKASRKDLPASSRRLMIVVTKSISFFTFFPLTSIFLSSSASAASFLA